MYLKSKDASYILFQSPTLKKWLKEILHTICNMFSGVFYTQNLKVKRQMNVFIFFDQEIPIVIKSYTTLLLNTELNIEDFS